LVQTLKCEGEASVIDKTSIFDQNIIFWSRLWNLGRPDDMEYKGMISDEHTQGESLKRTNRSILKILRAPKDMLRIQGRFSLGGILAIMIGGIALAEVIAMTVVYGVRDWPYSQQILLDAIIMTVIILPLLYFVSLKPLLLQIQQQYQSESIIQTRLRLMQFADTHTLDELLQFTLDEIEALTGSAISFFHFLEADQKRIRLQAWSTNTLQNMCKAEGKDSHYDVEQAGVWADAVRHRQTVIHNNYAALPYRKGTPEGHALVVREMVIPILRDNLVVAILGVGNKSQDFTANDVKLVSTMADLAWDIVEHKRADYALRQSEEKFRTIADWTYDWEKWLDPQGNVAYSSPSCERMTGYTPEEFTTDPGLLVRIVHPDDRQFYTEHHRIIHEASAGPVTVEYRIISRDGSEHWIEHVCRPLVGSDGRYLGRRISNRDITQRKQNERMIVEQHQKEAILTQTIQTIQTDIARDLHDTLGQNISFLRMNLEHLSETGLGDQIEMQVMLQSMIYAANESYDLIRAMLVNLQSGYSADPLSLFTRYAEQVAARSSMQIDIKSRRDPIQLSPHQIRQLFFIFREALSNIEKYAHAGQVSGEFLCEEHVLTLEISDNGRGFDPEAVQTTGHYGLKFMRERADPLKGSFLVQSAPGQGTTIRVVVPYEDQPPTQSQ
jgi:PAS domain S-box-containing protein